MAERDTTIPEAVIGEKPQGLETAWGVFTDERPDHTVRPGSIWPSLLGLVVLIGVAAGVYAREHELDGGLLDWTRGRAEPEVTATEEVGETAPVRSDGMDPPSAASVAPGVGAAVNPPIEPPPVVGSPVAPGVAPVVPSEPVVPPVVVPPIVNASSEPPPVAVPPVTGTSECALDGVLAGAWSYETVAVWAAHAELYDVRGAYEVEFTPQSACSYDTKVRKRRSGASVLSPPHSDRVQATAAPWAGGGRVEAEVRLAPRSEAALLAEDFTRDPAGRHYQFAYLFENEQLQGSWRALAGEGPLMLGMLRGGRTLVGPASLSVRTLPCRDQCAVRCPGEEARGRCERELCRSPTTRITDCGAPGGDFVAPAATRSLDAPLSFFDPGRAGEDHCRKIADHLAGLWTVHARATGGEHDGKEHTYTFELQPEGCRLVVKGARRGPWRVELAGTVRADGRWTLHYSDHGAEGDWMLVGRDPAFGTFRAKSGVQGAVAAYRTGER